MFLSVPDLVDTESPLVVILLPFTATTTSLSVSIVTHLNANSKLVFKS